MTTQPTTSHDGRYQLQHSQGRWYVDDAANPQAAVTYHRTRDAALEQLQRLQQRARAGSRSTRQPSLFDPKEGT